MANSLRETLGRESRMKILKSEDLPVIRTVNHEVLVNAEERFSFDTVI